MPPSGFKRKCRAVVASLVGLLLLFLLLELFFWGAGGVTRLNKEEPGARRAVKYTERVVLLMGDSHTNGYSGQLRALINEQDSLSILRVVDGARPGLNSSEVARHLRGFLPRIQPEVVIVLAGGTNDWNHAGYHQFAASHGKGGFGSWFNEALGQLRTVRLLRAIGAERKRRAAGGPVQGSPDTRFFSDLDKQAVAAKGPPLREDRLPLSMFERQAVSADLVPIIREAEQLAMADKFEQSLALYHKLLETPEKFNSEAFLVESTLEVGWMLSDLHRFKEARRWFRQAVLKFPKHKGPPEALLNLLLRGKHFAEIERIFGELSQQRPELRRYIDVARRRKALSNKRWEVEVDAWVRADLGAIIKICRAAGVRPILLSYPADREHASMIGQVARKHGVEFLDAHAFMRRVQTRGGKPEDYFLPDGHCTPRGYRALAQEVFRRFLGKK